MSFCQAYRQRAGCFSNGRAEVCTAGAIAQCNGKQRQGLGQLMQSLGQCERVCQAKAVAGAAAGMRELVETKLKAAARRVLSAVHSVNEGNPVMVLHLENQFGAGTVQAEQLNPARKWHRF